MASKEYHAAWREKSRGKTRAAEKKSYAKHADKRRAESAKWRADNPEKLAEYLTLESTREKRRAAMRRFEAKRLGYAECTEYPPPPSDNKCAICHVEAERLCLDHDHKTGKFRGYLCHNCNMGLGKLGDSVEAIRRVLAYLERGECLTAM
ncbi:hypothetical protein ABIA00_002459 [Bradyrhizobium ottawaense]|uniref:endonuclease domain-containing protein n=1 Tax=Bradyrhizobium ottawaense TaxID=931866 RepID=UPI0038353757